MTQIRIDRREAGFCEVNVWLPSEYAKDFRDLAWWLIDGAKRELPYRRARSSEDEVRSGVNSFMSWLAELSAANGSSQNGDHPK